MDAAIVQRLDGLPATDVVRLFSDLDNSTIIASHCEADRRQGSDHSIFGASQAVKKPHEPASHSRVPAAEL